jgi:hypothetical protein
MNQLPGSRKAINELFAACSARRLSREAPFSLRSVTTNSWLTIGQSLLFGTTIRGASWERPGASSASFRAVSNVCRTEGIGGLAANAYRTLFTTASQTTLPSRAVSAPGDACLKHKCGSKTSWLEIPCYPARQTAQRAPESSGRPPRLRRPVRPKPVRCGRRTDLSCCGMAEPAPQRYIQALVTACLHVAARGYLAPEQSPRHGRSSGDGILD